MSETTGWRMPMLWPGQVWHPDRISMAKSREIVWIGDDELYGEAVRWRHPETEKTSIMQEKAFRWWIRKHRAKFRLTGGRRASPAMAAQPHDTSAKEDANREHDV